MTQHTPKLLIISLLFGLAACNGIITDPGVAPGGPNPDPRIPTDPELCDPDVIFLGTAPMRRLSNVEYANTLDQLFEGDVPMLPTFPSDGVAEGKFENDARELGPDDVRIARYEESAWRVSEAVVTDPTRLAAFLPCASWATDAEARDCGAAFIEDFGKRALRRPLTADEATRYEALFEAQRAAIDFEAAVQLTMMAFLQAPQFLYRLELDTSSTLGDARVALSQHELASRLSYLMWESMPDDALMAAADAGELDDPTIFEGEVRRLLAHPRARVMVQDFHRQWLHMDRVLDENRDPALFPEWGDGLRTAVRDESMSFVDSVFFGEDPTLTALLTSRQVSGLTPELAALYGVDAGATMLPDTERAGILTRAAFLAGNAHAANGSPPLRGVHLMERYLCEPRPSPPPDADTSPPEQMDGDETMTNRQLFERRTASPACRSCHVRIDGFGFAFENYDAVGAFRVEENGLPIDASGNISGTDQDGPFVGAVELSEGLAESETVEECVTTQWFRFGHGRLEEPEDACQIWSLTDRLRESGGNLQELLVEMALTPEFRQRRIVE